MGINKFSSFVVFLFGILLLLVIAASFIMRWMEPPIAGGVRAQTIAPPCELPPLNVGAKEEFVEKLDKLFESGGISAIRDYVEKEFVPGRHVVIAPTTASESEAELVLIDREVRRCDADGAALLTVAPVLARATGIPVMNNDVHLSSWSRPLLKEPFYITTWWVQRK